MKTNYFKSARVVFTISSSFMISLNAETCFSKPVPHPNKKAVTLQYHVFTVFRPGRDSAMRATHENLK